MPKMKEIPVVKDFLTVLINHLKTNRITASITKIRNHDKLLNALLESEFSFASYDCGFCLDFRCPYPQFNKQSVLHFILINSGKPNSEDNLQIDFRESEKYPAFLQYFANRGDKALPIASLLNSSDFEKTGYKGIMSIDEFKTYLSEKTKEGRLVGIEVD